VRLRVVAALVLAGLAGATLTGCAGSPADSGATLRTHVQVDSPELRRAKADAAVERCPPATGGERSDLPSLRLPCLGGGRAVTLAQVRGPAVISLWASWCTSCPHELPLYQRLHRETGDRLTVLGVDWEDTQPGAAIELLRRTGARVPQLADPGGDLADHYRIAGLPGILLVDGQGRVTFRLQRIDTYAQLADLVADHTGVEVSAG
jgi:thiol-disulfide isomerase/thioredoxin